MTIPEHIREEAEACYLHCEQMDSYGIIETIATALLAAEQRGMERAEEIAEARELTGHPRLSPGAEINAWWSGQEAASQEIAAAIRKAREQMGDNQPRSARGAN